MPFITHWLTVLLLCITPISFSSSPSSSFGWSHFSFSCFGNKNEYFCKYCSKRDFRAFHSLQSLTVRRQRNFRRRRRRSWFSLSGCCCWCSVAVNLFEVIPLTLSHSLSFGYSKADYSNCRVLLLSFGIFISSALALVFPRSSEAHYLLLPIVVIKRRRRRRRRWRCHKSTEKEKVKENEILILVLMILFFLVLLPQSARANECLPILFLL